MPPGQQKSRPPFQGDGIFSLSKKREWRGKLHNSVRFADANEPQRKNWKDSKFDFALQNQIAVTSAGGLRAAFFLFVCGRAAKEQDFALCGARPRLCLWKPPAFKKAGPKLFCFPFVQFYLQKKFFDSLFFLRPGLGYPCTRSNLSTPAPQRGHLNPAGRLPSFW